VDVYKKTRPPVTSDGPSAHSSPPAASDGRSAHSTSSAWALGPFYRHHGADLRACCWHQAARYMGRPQPDDLHLQLSNKNTCHSTCSSHLSSSIYPYFSFSSLDTRPSTASNCLRPDKARHSTMLPFEVSIGLSPRQASHKRVFLWFKYPTGLSIC
jgi:hypothetical protein